MITPAYAPTATERVLPRLALDFTTGVLDSRVAVTRALNTATRVNSSGYIEIINANLPRFDYDPVTLAPLGLLIEETRANILLRSEEFNLASWTKIRSSVTPDAILSPAGIVNADKLIEDTTATSSHFMLQIPAASASTTYTYSVYLKAAERNRAMLEDGGGSNAQAYFDLLNGTVISTSASVTATIRNAGNGFYRCIMTFTTAVGQTGINARIYLINTGTNISYTGDGVSGIYVYGAQLEAGAFATSYIPTTTTSLTRNADVALMTGTNFSSWYATTAGSFVMGVTPRAALGTRPLVQVDDGSANNLICLRQNVADPELYIVSGGSPQAQIDAGTVTANTAYKLAGAWNTNDCVAAKDGGTPGTDLSATIPSPNQLRLGSDGTNYGNMWISSMRYWPQKIINAEAQAFSK